MEEQSTIVRVNGPVVFADHMGFAGLGEQVDVGHEKLTGEIIGLDRNIATIQVYEDTTGLKPGEPVAGRGEPLSVWLAPGILRNVYDGIQRPLEKLHEQSGTFLARGLSIAGVDLDRSWPFTPTVKAGV